jgi:hypothetical protein
MLFPCSLIVPLLSHLLLDMCSHNMFVSYIQSGGTPETRNGLLEVQKAFRDAGLDFSKQVLTSGSFFLHVIYILKGKC